MIHREELQEEERRRGCVCVCAITTITEHLLSGTNGNTGLFCACVRSKVRGQSRPWLKWAGGPSSAPLTPDPDSDAQNLVPMWDVFTYRSEGVGLAHSVDTRLQHTAAKCGNNTSSCYIQGVPQGKIVQRWGRLWNTYSHNTLTSRETF